MFFTRKHSTAGEGLLVKTLIIPLGNDIVTSPVIFTIHLTLEDMDKCLNNAFSKVCLVLKSVCMYAYTYSCASAHIDMHYILS